MPRWVKVLLIIVAGLVGLVIIGTLAAVVGSGGLDRTQYSKLQPGQCFNRSGASHGDVTVKRVSCDSPHNAEATGRIEEADGPWPGLAGFDANDATTCQRDARLYYVGPLRSDSEPALIYPQKSAWNDGERLVVCELRTTAGNKIRGSFSGSGS